jgi:hypothetical protein
MLQVGAELGLTSPDIAGRPDLVAHYRRHFPDGLSAHGIRYLHSGSPDPAKLCEAEAGERQGLLQHLVNCDIEIILELVRRVVAPDAPSRFVSTFAWGSPNDVRRFSEMFGFSLNDYSTFELDADDGFRADLRWLKGGSKLSIWHDAEQYWRQQPFDPEPLWEYVIALPCKVVDKRSH